MSETQIQSAIQDALRPLPFVRLFRNKQAGRGRLKAGLGKGTSDLVGVLTRRDGAGLFMALEVKRDEKAEASPKQLEFIADIRSRGGVADVVWSVEMALARVLEWRIK